MVRDCTMMISFEGNNPLSVQHLADTIKVDKVLILMISIT